MKTALGLWALGSSWAGWSCRALVYCSNLLYSFFRFLRWKMLCFVLFLEEKYSLHISNAFYAKSQFWFFNKDISWAKLWMALKLCDKTLCLGPNVLYWFDLAIVLLISIYRSWILNEEVKNRVKIWKIKSSKFSLDSERLFTNSISYRTRIYLSQASLENFKARELFSVSQFLLQEGPFFHHYFAYFGQFSLIKYSWD